MKHVTIRSVAVFALVAALGVSIPSVAYASSTTPTTTPSASFIAAQQKLEGELATRVTRLTHLSADVTAATSLSSNVSLTLQARLSTEEASINALVAKVPTDTTWAELDADRSAMYKDNRVYAVMSPQVFE
jgi:cytochrome c oxidase assembly factor CtaG